MTAGVSGDTSLAELHRRAAERGLARFRVLSKAELLEALAEPLATPEPLPPVRLERDGPLATVVLDDPETRNALGRTAMDAFAAALDELEADREVRLVAVVGAGGVFCSGARVHEFDTTDGGAELSDRGSALFDRLAALPVPVVALLNGPAVGAGAQLALAADRRLVAPDGDLRFVHVGLGLVPAFGGTSRLRDVIGAGAALLLLGARAAVDADGAVRLGLASEIVPAAELRERARDLAEHLEESDRAAVAALKRTLAAPPHEARAVERAAFLEAWPNRRIEGVPRGGH